MGGWSLGNFDVIVELGHNDDSDLDVVVKAQDISLGSVTVKEGSNAEDVIFWPGISMSNPDRRAEIFTAASGALDRAVDMKAKKVGFFTMGLEVSRIPSWEVAEEIVKAIASHSKTENSLDRVLLVASSPMQVSSFQYALNNISVLTEE